MPGSYHRCPPCSGMTPCLEEVHLATKVKASQLPSLASDSIMCVGMPVASHQGFWVRVATVLAHAKLAHNAGLQVATCGEQTGYDLYTNQSNPALSKSWDSFFLPIGHQAPTSNPRKMVQLDCSGAVEVWGHSGVRYSSTFEELESNREWFAATASSLPILPQPSIAMTVDDYWRREVRPAPGQRVLGVHIRGTDARTDGGANAMNVRGFVAHFTSVRRYKPFIDAYAAMHPGCLVYLATDSETLLSEFFSLYPGTASNYSDENGGSSMSTPPRPFRVIYQRAATRGSSTAHGIHIPVHSAGRAPATAAFDVLIDTLLLARCDYLLKTTSWVGEAAVIMNPSLLGRVYDFGVADHPLPSWMQMCSPLVCSLRHGTLSPSLVGSKLVPPVHSVRDRNMTLCAVTVAPLTGSGCAGGVRAHPLLLTEGYAARTNEEREGNASAREGGSI
jgi:hypothetical protein